jgi:hypothetical protein
MTRVWGYGLGQGRPFLPAASGPLREFHLVLSGGMMARMPGRSTAGAIPRPPPWTSGRAITCASC